MRSFINTLEAGEWMLPRRVRAPAGASDDEYIVLVEAENVMPLALPLSDVRLPLDGSEKSGAPPCIDMGARLDAGDVGGRTKLAGPPAGEGPGTGDAAADSGDVTDDSTGAEGAEGGATAAAASAAAREPWTVLRRLPTVPRRARDVDVKDISPCASPAAPLAALPPAGLAAGLGTVLLPPPRPCCWRSCSACSSSRSDAAFHTEGPAAERVRKPLRSAGVVKIQILLDGGSCSMNDTRFCIASCTCAGVVARSMLCGAGKKRRRLCPVSLDCARLARERRE